MTHVDLWLKVLPPLKTYKCSLTKRVWCLERKYSQLSLYRHSTKFVTVTI